MFQIADDEKTLFIGTEEEMQLAYFIMAWDEKTLRQMFQEERLQQLKDKYRVPHVGKIKMLPYAQYEGGQTQPDAAKD